jgi:hypothetical protein
MSRAQHVLKRQRRDPSRHRIRAKGPSDTSMGQRPMLGAAPCHGHNTSPSANGATHPGTAHQLGVADVDCAGLWNGPSALVSGWRSVAWGVAPGWYEAAPLALALAAAPKAGGRPWPAPRRSCNASASDVHLRAKGPYDTSMGHRPMLGIAPCHGHNTSSSANGAIHPGTASGPKARPIPAWGNAPCWAPPHATGTTRPRAPTARPIPAPHQGQRPVRYQHGAPPHVGHRPMPRAQHVPRAPTARSIL